MQNNMYITKPINLGKEASNTRIIFQNSTQETRHYTNDNRSTKHASKFVRSIVTPYKDTVAAHFMSYIIQT